MTFGELLKDRIRQLGITQLAFAQAVESSSGHISDVINGRRTPPLDRVSIWATELKLDGELRAQFIQAAMAAHAPAALGDELHSFHSSAQKGAWMAYLVGIGFNRNLLSKDLRSEIESSSDDHTLFDKADRLGPLAWEEMQSVEKAAGIPVPATLPSRISNKIVTDEQLITALHARIKITADELDASKQLLAKANAEIARQQQDILALSRQLADMRQQLERQNPQPTT